MDWRAPGGESELSCYKSQHIGPNSLPVKVRICAGAARFGESVGIRGWFGRALSGQLGARLGRPRSPGESGGTIYI